VWGLGLLIASSAHAQPSEAVEAEPPAAVEAEYRGVVARAVAEFDLGHVAEARALFLRAHALWPSARTLRTLGMTAFELRMYPQALSELQAAFDDPRRPLPPEQRAQVAGLIEQARGYVGRYRLQLEPRDAELWLDGSRVQPTETLVLGVGMHQLRARAPGYGEIRRELIVEGREDETLVLHLELTGPQPSAASAKPAPRPEAPSHIPAIIAFSVAGAGVVVGTLSGLIAYSKKHDTDPTAGQRAADISTVSWISAGVGALAGVLLLVLEPEPARAPQAMRPRVTLGVLGFEGRF
jgi:hypothetical protein